MTLQEHIDAGNIWSTENDEYYGKAADGITVFVGNVGDEEQVERYLADHPNTSDW